MTRSTPLPSKGARRLARSIACAQWRANQSGDVEGIGHTYSPTSADSPCRRTLSLIPLLVFSTPARSFQPSHSACHERLPEAIALFTSHLPLPRHGLGDIGPPPANGQPFWVGHSVASAYTHVSCCAVRFRAACLFKTSHPCRRRPILHCIPVAGSAISPSCRRNWSFLFTSSSTDTHCGSHPSHGPPSRVRRAPKGRT